MSNPRDIFKQETKAYPAMQREENQLQTVLSKAPLGMRAVNESEGKSKEQRTDSDLLEQDSKSDEKNPYCIETGQTKREVNGTAMREAEAARQEAEHKAKSRQKQSRFASRLKTKEGKAGLAVGLLLTAGLVVFVAVIVSDLGKSTKQQPREDNFDKLTEPALPKPNIADTKMTADIALSQMRKAHRRKVRERQQQEERIRLQVVQEYKQSARENAGRNEQVKDGQNSDAETSNVHEDKTMIDRKASTRKNPSKGRIPNRSGLTITRKYTQQDPKVPELELVATGKIVRLGSRKQKEKKKATRLDLEPGTRIQAKLETGINSRYSRQTVLARVTAPLITQKGVVITKDSMLRGKHSSGSSRIFVEFFEVVVVDRGRNKLRAHAVSGSLPGIPAKASANSRSKSSSGSRAEKIAKRTSLRALGDTATRLVPAGSIISDIGTDIARESVNELRREDYLFVGQVELEVPAGTRFTVVITD